MRRIKLFDPAVGKNEENAIKRILHNHNWASGIGGENVYKFGKKNFKIFRNKGLCCS